MLLDIRGIEITIGARVFFTNSDDGNFNEGTVTGFTKNMTAVYIYDNRHAQWNPNSKYSIKRKDPKFIVVI